MFDSISKNPFLSFLFNKHLFNMLCLLCLGLLWGATIPLNNLIAVMGYSYVLLMFWQFLIICCVLLPFRFKYILFNLTRRTPPLIISSLIGTLLPGVILLYVGHYLKAEVIAIIMATTPIISTLYSNTQSEYRSNIFLTFLGLLFGFSSILVLFWDQFLTIKHSFTLKLLLIGFIAPLAYALEGQLLKRYFTKQKPQPLDLLLGSAIIGLFITGILIVVLGESPIPKSLGTKELIIIANTLLHILAYAIYIWIIDRTTPAFAAKSVYFITIFGVIFSIVIFHSPIYKSLFISTIMAVISIFISLYVERHRYELAYPDKRN